MRKFYITGVFTAFLLISCSKSDDNPAPTPTPTPPTAVTLKNPINNFTWKAMNSWYNWQTSVPNLADTKDDNQNDYYTYLNGFSTPQQLFKSLIYQEGVVDRFSWFIEDYVEQQKQFQGISTSFGFRFKLVRVDSTDDVIFYIQYVTPGSPADNAGFKRGDIVNAINGNKMTVNNYRTVLNGYYNDTAEFSFVESDGSTLIEKKTITRAVVADNPVYLTKVFDNVAGKKVGYVVYNGFRSSYNDELNAAFAELKTAGVQELILDFRINGGGSVQTCSYLASMIHKEANTDNFAELRFNSKNTNQNGIYKFQDNQNVYDANGSKVREEAINRISGLSRIYVLTSGSTASASEMIINGLKPFIEVKTVGTTTYGKNVGSITLYDSPSSQYTNVNSANPSHKNAMQPIVFQIFNKSGQSDYTQGFEPTIEVKEFESWRNILPFGNENETVLKAALDDIRGVAARPSYNSSDNSEALEDDFTENKFEKEMYIEGDFFKNK